MASTYETMDVNNFIVTDLVTPPLFFERYEDAFHKAHDLTEKTGRNFYMFTEGQYFVGKHPYKFESTNAPFYMGGDSAASNPFDFEQAYPHYPQAFSTIEETEKECIETFIINTDFEAPLTIYQITPLFDVERAITCERSY